MAKRSFSKGFRGWRARAASFLLAAGLLVVFGVPALAGPDIVQGDKVTVMGNAEVPVDTTIDGDVVTVMGNTVISGRVTGDAATIMGNVTINGEVFGDVVAVMGNVDLGPDARIHGAVSVAMGQVNRNPNAVVRDVQVDERQWNVDIGGLRGLQGLQGLQGLHGLQGLSLLGLPFGFLGPVFFFTRWLVGLALLLLVVALFPGAAQSVATVVEKDLGKSLLVGLLAMLAAIPVGIVLLITLIGPVVWAFFLVIASFFGKAAVTLLIGRRVHEAIRQPEEGEARSLAWDAVIGSVVLGLASLVPLLGGLAIFLVYMAGLGAVLFSKFGTNQPWFGRAA